MNDYSALEERCCDDEELDNRGIIISHIRDFVNSSQIRELETDLLYVVELMLICCPIFKLQDI